MKSYIVIGLGLFGGETARKLSQLGCEVLAMDLRSDLVNQVANDVTHAVVRIRMCCGLWVLAISIVRLLPLATIWRPLF